jgi:hypothetical protein
MYQKKGEKKMQETIVVSEENHGLLCIAKDFQSAVDFLIKEYWIDEATEVYVDARSEWVRLDELFGEDWEKEIRNLSRKSFEELFDESIYLEDAEVYGT